MKIKPPKTKQFSENRANLLKECRAQKETIVFSYSHLCSDVNHNFECLKSKKHNSVLADTVCSLTNKMFELSKMTWEQLYLLPKRSGFEYIPVSQFSKTFINSIDYKLTGDDKLIIVRFYAQDCRLVLKRGSKCGRVAQVLGIDLDLDLYNH
jgi:hypothetical protein